MGPTGTLKGFPTAPITTASAAFAKATAAILSDRGAGTRTHTDPGVGDYDFGSWGDGGGDGGAGGG